ncbi:MAG: PA0069 family radical SAM protein [Pseudomonadota bacterium]
MTEQQKLPKYGRVTRENVASTRERFSHRGRGSISNPTGRFEPEDRSAFDDGWGTIEDDVEPLRTTLTPESAKTIISFNRSPDIHFDRSINPYRGCEHGCVYCFARPTHSYHGLSAGLDFESKLFFKPNGPDLLRATLAKPSYNPRPIALGVNTDAYQPIERRLQLTRTLLQILKDHNHPVTLLTKSNVITRDIDLIAPMAEKGLVSVGVSITTLDKTLARKMEPRAATPPRRLDAIRQLSEAGIPTAIMTAPIIPALNDDEIEALVEAGADAGAGRAGYVLLRLPYELKDLFHEWLAEHAPDKAARVVNLLREIRGGKDYDAKWFERGHGSGVYATLIGRRFQRVTRKFGLNQPRPALRTDLFVPGPSDPKQMSLDI